MSTKRASTAKADVSTLCEVKSCKAPKAPWAIKYCPAHSLLARIEKARRIADWGQNKGFEKFANGFDVSYHYQRFADLSKAEQGKVLKALPKDESKVLADLLKNPAKFAQIQALRRAKPIATTSPMEFTPDQIEIVKAMLEKVQRRAIRVASR